jgi:hypothetical protein
LKALQSQNILCVNWLNFHGYDGDVLKAEVKRRPQSVRASLTQPNSKERVQALARAKTHGDIFHVTGGAHHTADDFFVSRELKERKESIAQLKKAKGKRQELEEREKAALALLEKGTENDKLKKPELELLLSWHGIAKAHQPKGNNAKMEKWKEIVYSKKAAPRYDKWTDAD